MFRSVRNLKVVLSVCALLNATSAHAQSQLPAAQLETGLRLLHRKLHFDGVDSPSSARPFNHKLRVGPVLFVRGAFYPWAFVNDGPLSQFGLLASFERLIATDSEFFEGTESEARAATVIQQYQLGARVRQPIAAHDVGVSAQFGRHTSDLADITLDGKRGALVPDIRYTFFSAAVDATLRFGRFSTGAALGTRFVLDTGSLEEQWFDVTKIRMIDLSLSTSYQLTKYVALSAAFQLQRYGMKLSPQSGVDAMIANAASDTYLSGSLGVLFALPGTAQ